MTLSFNARLNVLSIQRANSLNYFNASLNYLYVLLLLTLNYNIIYIRGLNSTNTRRGTDKTFCVDDVSSARFFQFHFKLLWCTLNTLKQNVSLLREQFKIKFKHFKPHQEVNSV
jgi:hypothetical protein